MFSTFLRILFFGSSDSSKNGQMNLNHQKHTYTDFVNIFINLNAKLGEQIFFLFTEILGTLLQICS